MRPHDPAIRRTRPSFIAEAHRVMCLAQGERARMQPMHPAHEQTAERAKSRVGRRALWGYGLLTLAILVPGIILRLLGPIVDETAASPLRLAAQKALEPISFMSGLRFWLGVAGTTMMALLLLYPLRKRLGRARLTGSVGGWFHSHLALGLIGPALILYHANFGFGSFNANVALWSIAIVIASGLVAMTVYLAASERMARARNASSESLDAVLRILNPAGHRDLAGARLSDDIRTLQQRIEEHRGIVLDAPLRREKSMIVDSAMRYVREASVAAGASPHEAQQLAANFCVRLKASFKAARRSARSAMTERALRLWRLSHLPVIAVGAIATTLHVYAVWGVYDAPMAAPTDPSVVPQALPPSQPRASPSIEIAGVRQAPFAPKRTVASDETAADVAQKEPVLKQGPVPISRSSSAETTARAPVTPPEPRQPTPTSFKPQPPPAPEAGQAAGQLARQQRNDEGAAAVAELKRRNGAAPQRVGDLNGLTLAARIAELKDSGFDHARTKFPLTGGHKRVACETCHIKTLIDTPRDCIACHKKDDAHRGRRPDCAACHTTNRWSEITRRR